MDKTQWRTEALHALTRWARKQHGPFSIEMAREGIAEQVKAPKDLRWWGSVTRSAIRAGVLWPCRAKTIPARSSHGSPKPAYLAVKG